jgi:hypothetical protein
LGRNKFAELKPREVQAPKILISVMTILRGESKMLSKINLPHDNLPMRMKIMRILKNKIRILLFLMLRQKIIIMRMKMGNYFHLIKNKRKLRRMRSLYLLQEKILNHLFRRIRRRNIQIHKKVKIGIHGCIDPYPIPKR